MDSEQTSLYERIVEALQSPDNARLIEVLAEANAADIAETFDLLTDEERSRIILDGLSSHTAAEVVVMLDEAVRGDLVDDLKPQQVMEIVAELTPDDAADVLGELTEEEAEDVLGHMTEEQSDRIGELMGYDETTAGGIMTPDVVAVPASATVADAVEYVRQATPEDELHEVYIVDDDQKLLGIVPLRRLVTSSPSTKLADLRDPDLVKVFAHEDQEVVVREIRKYDVVEAAVVDEEGRLLGRITHDDLLDVADEEAEEDLLRLAGTDPSELDTSSVLAAARIRLMWLMPCMVGMLLTATVLAVARPQFDVRLFATLLLFVPMIAAMGGNSGIQISTVIVRGFATMELGSTKLGHVLLREGRIVLALAPVCGLAAWALAKIAFPFFKWLEGPAVSADVGRVPFAIGIAMACAILVAGTLGVALPFTFRKLGADPAIASGPLVTTMNDVASVAIYMSLAMVIAR